jgi:hypothetical protein
MTDKDKLTDITEDPTIVVAMDGGDKVAIMVSPIPFMQQHGTDPGIWADVFGSLFESVCKAHADALSDAEGNHPPIEDVRERILECLPDAFAEKAGGPVFEHVKGGEAD